MIFPVIFGIQVSVESFFEKNEKKLLCSFIRLPCHFFHKGDKKMHTLRRLSGLEERHSWGKVLGGGVGIFSQEVKGQGPLNQHFGPLKLSAITSQTHS